MATRAFACPNCKMKLTAPEGADRFRCPRCKTVLTAPAAETAEGLGTRDEGRGEGSEPRASDLLPPSASGPLAAQAPAMEAGLPELPAPEPAPLDLPAPAAAAPVPGDELALLGRTLGSYEVRRYLGSGGIGAVYEAVQEGLNRRVALKVLPPHAAADRAFYSAFRREAQAAARLSHPNVLPIFDICEEQGVLFFAMEYVDGESLAARLQRQGPLTVSEALQLAAHVASALDHANEHMLLHRNLKPENILLPNRGDVKLADLSLAKCLEPSPAGIAEATFGGPVYLAPEYVANPQLADCRADIYSLGCVLYHALTGQPPFPGPSVRELLDQHIRAPFPSVRALVPRIPQTVDDLLRKMTAKDPAERFQTHAELAAHIEGLLQSTTVRAPRAGREAPSSSVKWLVLGGAAALLGIALGAFLLLRGPKPAPQVKVPDSVSKDVMPKPRDEEAPPEFNPDEVPSTTIPGPKGTTPPDAKEPPKETPAPPKEKGPEEPAPKEAPKEKEPPKPAPPPEWQAKLAEARQAAEPDARAGRFGKAIETIEALAKDSKDDALRAAVAGAANALRQQAADAARVALRSASDLADKGQYAEAKAALQAVVDNCGTPAETQLAKAGLDAVAAHERLRAAAAQAARDSASAAQDDQRRAQAREQLAKSLEPVEEQIKGWKLAEAAAALAALKPDGQALAAEVALRKAAVEGLLALRRRMIQHIKTAQPHLMKSTLRIPGLNGALVDATEIGFRIETKMGEQVREEKLAWTQLRPVSAELLAQRVAKPDSAADALGTALLLDLLGDAEKAKAHRERAAGLGAAAAPAPEAAPASADAPAAEALAEALAHALAGRRAEAAAALDAFQKDFGDSAYAQKSKDTLALARAYQPIVVPGAPTPPPPTTEPPTKTPEPPKPEPKGKAEPLVAQPPPPKAQPKGKPEPARPADPAAVALYQQAVQAFQQCRFDVAKKHLDDLKAKFPADPIHGDAARNPSVSALLQAIAARGPQIIVSKSAEGAVRSLAEALRALDKPNATVLVEPGTYVGGAVLFGAKAGGLILHGSGEAAPRLDGGANRHPVLRFAADAPNVLLDHLEFANTETALFIGPRCSATLRDLVALSEVTRGLDKAPDASVTIHGSLLALAGLPSATARGSAFATDETPLDHGQFTACLLVGPEIALLNMTLTDCVLLGPVTLLGGCHLDHVTIVGTVSLPEPSVGNVITNSIVESIEAWKPDPRDKEKPSVALTIKCTALRREGNVSKDLVKADDKVKTVPIEFAHPAKGDYRLPAESPLRGKAADNTDLGCRFPAELLDLLKRAQRFPSLLHPPARKPR